MVIAKRVAPAPLHNIRHSNLALLTPLPVLIVDLRAPCYYFYLDHNALVRSSPRNPFHEASDSRGKRAAQMEKQMNDFDLSKALGSDIHDDYATALDFISTIPDYSLLQFRKIAECLVLKLAHRNNVKFTSDRLLDRINVLVKNQMLTSSLETHFHEIRKLGNSGVHTPPDFKGSGAFYDERRKTLVASAHDARKTVVAIFEEIYCIFHKRKTEGSIELVPAGQQAYRETLYDACLSDCPKMKLKAGITCESIMEEQSFHAPLLVSSNFAAHIHNLRTTALSFYEASCAISARIDDNLRRLDLASREPDDIICANADVEALFKYAVLAVSDEHDTVSREKGMARLKASADRCYGPAEALYGALLYDDNKFDEALHYLALSESKDEVLSLRFLFYVYSEGKACPVDINMALKYLDRAIELGCPDALATLGEAYHKGTLVSQNREKAKELLEQSIKMGSAIGKRYYIVEFNDLPGQFAKRMKALGEDLQRTIAEEERPKPIRAGKKIGANEPCPCGSGKKYKKCCKNAPKLLGL